MDNMKLWNKFKETDPKFTKSFQRGGGFKGTATDPMYIVMRMTEEFGPNGIGWGWEIVDETYVEGAPLKKNEAVKAIIHKILLRLWYMEGETKHFSSPQFGLTTFVGEYSTAGIYTDEEHAKKSVTDAISKCAVQLGIAADIHMGLYDDNKYIKSLHDKFDKKEQVTKETEKDEPLFPGGITAKNRKQLHTLATKHEWPTTAVKSLVASHGFDSSSKITADKFEAIKDDIKKGPEVE